MKHNRILEMEKAQSAIEYLMTYGWMLLVVAIVGGAIFSMVGEQRIESTSGFNSNDIEVRDFGTTLNSLQMNIETFSANKIELKEIKFGEINSKELKIPLNEEISTGDNMLLNLPHFKSSENTNEIEVELIYDTGGLSNISTQGTITGELEVDTSIVGYWTLNQNQANETHVYDISGNGNHGELVNSPSFVDSLVGAGDALRFDGETQEVLVDNPGENLRVVDDMTLSVWYESLEELDNDSSDRRIIMETHHRAEFKYDIWGSDNPDGERYRAWHGNDTDTDSHSGSITDSEWSNNINHAAVVRDLGAEEIRFYHNGELVRTSSIEITDIVSREDNLTINRAESSRSWEAIQDEVRVYNRTLSNREIRSLYNNPGLVR